jgi:hypothetical protein
MYNSIKHTYLTEPTGKEYVCQSNKFDASSFLSGKFSHWCGLQSGSGDYGGRWGTLQAAHRGELL